MDHASFTHWMDTIDRAWVNRDPQLAADLFTEDALYQENPFDEPLHGREAIYQYWAKLPQEQDQIEFDYKVLEVTPTTGIASWTATFVRLPSGIKSRLEGVLVATFAEGSNRAHDFREWWHSQDYPSVRRVALITGASRGLGLTLAEFLAAQGYDLIITARGTEVLRAAADTLQIYGTRITALAGDVADAAHRRRLVETAESMGRLDLLMNNASILGPTPLLTLADYPLAELQNVFLVNTIAPLGLVQEALPLLKSSGGLVVNISSDAAVGGYETWGGYGASKSALDLLTRTLANELRDAGVGAVSVDPGDMRTVMQQQASPGQDISGIPEPAVTLPFWGWLLGQNVLDISGNRFQAQAEQWEILPA